MLFKKKKEEPKIINANESLLKIKECQNKLTQIDSDCTTSYEIAKKYLGKSTLDLYFIRDIIQGLRNNKSENETLEEVFLKLVEETDRYFDRLKTERELREAIESEKKLLGIE